MKKLTEVYSRQMSMEIVHFSDSTGDHTDDTKSIGHTIGSIVPYVLLLH